MNEEIYKVYDVSQRNQRLIASGIRLDEALELYDTDPIQRIIVHCSLIEGEFICKKINICPDSTCRNRVKKQSTLETTSYQENAYSSISSS